MNENQPATSADGFSALLSLILASRQNPLSATLTAEQAGSGTIDTDPSAPSRSRAGGPLPALIHSLWAPSVPNNSEASWHSPAFVSLLPSNGTAPSHGALVNATGDSSGATGSMAVEASTRVALNSQMAGELAGDQQAAEPGETRTSEPSGKDLLPMPDRQAAAIGEQPAASPPPTVPDRMAGFDCKPERGAVLHGDDPVSAQSAKNVADHVRAGPANALQSDNSQALAGGLDMTGSFADEPAPIALAKTPAPAVSAPASFAAQVSQRFAPTASSSSARPAARSEQLEAPLADPEESGVRPQYALADQGRSAATPQDTAAGQHRDAPFSTDAQGDWKPGDHLRKDHGNVSSAAASFAAIHAPSPELHVSAEVRSTDWPAPVIHQVAGEIPLMIRTRRHEAIMTLDPPELGNLKIGLAVDGDRVQVHIVAETPESRELLENHIPELKQALQSQRLEIAEVRVEAGRLSGFSGDPRHGSQHAPQERRPWDGTLGKTFGADTVSLDATVCSVRSEAGRVSMWA